MKTILLSFLTLSAFAAGTLAADDAGPNFLTTGLTYSLTYNDTNESVGSKNLPNVVTIVGRAGGSWYLVKRADGTERIFQPELWINFNSVSAVTLNVTSPSNAPNK
jgi:hypothetical protein